MRQSAFHRRYTSIDKKAAKLAWAKAAREAGKAKAKKR